MAKETSAAVANRGRYGSRAVRLASQAPLMPRETRTNGTTQHSDAPIAAAALVSSAQRGEVLEVDVSTGASYLPYLGTESSSV
jgi:hypothetical protein